MSYLLLILIGPMIAAVVGVLILGMIPNVLTIGEPGSGKSFGSAADVLAFRGAAFVGDGHKDSLTRLVLTHATGDVLYDRVDDLDHAPGYGLLKAPKESDPDKFLQESRKRAKLFVDVMVRRRGGDLSGTPLMEEWVMALLMLFLYQSPEKNPSIIPFGFRPGTDEFKALRRDCRLAELRHKFGQLDGINPRALRAEVGSSTRLVDGVCGDPSFLRRCRTTFDLGAFIQKGGKLLVERGNADPDVTRTIICGLNLLIADHCESRPKPWPPVGIWLDECTNARTAGDFEERKAGETRKAGLHWRYICQHPNFPNGPEGFYQNCQEKHFYRTGDHTLARKLAGFVVGGMRRGDKSRAELIDDVVADLMTFKPGWRYVVGPNGSRMEYVPMLREPWPNWPLPGYPGGLREAKLAEKIRCIHERPEYRAALTPSANTSTPASPPQASSPDDSSPATRLKRDGKKPPDGSADNGSENASA